MKINCVYFTLHCTCALKCAVKAVRSIANLAFLLNPFVQPLQQFYSCPLHKSEFASCKKGL